MKNWFKRILGIEALEEKLQDFEINFEEERLIYRSMIDQSKAQLKEETETVQKLEKKLAEYEKPSKKDQATANQEPYVEILNIDFDQKNPSKGSIELDWNSHFVSLLKSHGYSGKSDEIIVDKWFTDLCKTIGLETWENADDSLKLKIVKKQIDEIHSEVS